MRSTIDLCGRWELIYSDARPEVTSAIPEFKNTYTTEAVPGYWEDMMPALQMAPYWNLVKFNPHFRPLRYPMSGTVPDMVLETIVGCFWYRRNVFVDFEDCGKSVIFHCGGVQNRALLWVNGHFAGEHCGYSSPFSFDITDFIDFGGANEIILAVSNHEAHNESGEIISGLTSRAANLYTGGVMGEISLELRNPDAIADLYTSAYELSTDSITVYSELTGDKAHSLLWEIFDEDIFGEAVPLQSGKSDSSQFTIVRNGLSFWSPKTPKLYRLKLTLLSNGEITDTSELSIGFRQLRAEEYHLKFNGEPIFLRGICEHCYFPRTVHPESNISYYLDVIRGLKQMDFNFIRFHTWVPTEEYMTAADKLGILLHIESPNNTTEAEWADIIRFVRRHPSVVICCCGNELLIDDSFLEHLERCADICHTMAPGLLFSPMSALRGVEYYWTESNLGDDVCEVPFKHNPTRLKRLQDCSDVFSSFALGHLSYESVKGDPDIVDSWADTLKLPRLSHEICIHGTYVDLGLEWRYEGTRIGESEVFSSVRDILKKAGVLHRAPLYYVNSCQWQKLLRKHCFENARLCKTMAGYDFLGNIDTHWHTFGYRVGLMNEFYELKPTETIENIRRYNSESVLLTDLGINHCFSDEDTIRIQFLISLFGGANLENARLDVRFESLDKQVLSRFRFDVNAENGCVSEIALLETPAPHVEKPSCIRVCARISEDFYEIENEWDIWVFPNAEDICSPEIICTTTLDEDIWDKLENGADVLLLGAGPFASNPLSFRMSLAGRTAGNLATVIENHPLTETFEHEGFCGWQFAGLMDNASCLYYKPESEVPFDPIIEVVSSYKWIRKQAAVAEFQVGAGRILISTFNLSADDAAAKWWKKNLLRYMTGKTFAPRNCVTAAQLRTLYADGTSAAGGANDNVARNVNDRTMNK